MKTSSESESNIGSRSIANSLSSNSRASQKEETRKIPKSLPAVQLHKIIESGLQVIQNTQPNPVTQLSAADWQIERWIPESDPTLCSLLVSYIGSTRQDLLNKKFRLHRHVNEPSLFFSAVYDETGTIEVNNSTSNFDNDLHEKAKEHCRSTPPPRPQAYSLQADVADTRMRHTIRRNVSQIPPTFGDRRV
ncbi:MAG TPA: hypothetical protein DHW64_11780 [Chitinophagaceae bacterium]|nr:hypothetical protein [Chitinophagaceae bacterium]